MKKTCFFLPLFLLLSALLTAQTTFPETYFSPNHPKPTGEILDYIKTPERMYLLMRTPYSGPYARECVMAVDQEGQQVWNSFHWDFLSNTDLSFDKMVLASDGSLYLIVTEGTNALGYNTYFLKIDGQSGVQVWKKKFSSTQNPYDLVERVPGEIGVLYSSAVTPYFSYLRTYSAQDGSVLRDVFFNKYGEVGIKPDAVGNLIFARGDSLYKVNGIDPSLVYWRTYIGNTYTGGFGQTVFVMSPDGQHMIFWAIGHTSLDFWIQAKVDLNTGAATIIRILQTTGGDGFVDQPIIRGDTAFICYTNQGTFNHPRFFFSANKISDGSILYEKSYQIIDPATNMPYNANSSALSMAADQVGNLYLSGFSSEFFHSSGRMSAIKVHGADGALLWQKVIDLSPTVPDEVSYGRVAWIPDNGKLWIGGTIQHQPFVRTPILYEMNQTNGSIISENQLAGNYHFASALTQFMPLADGFCALRQSDNCIGVTRYDTAFQVIWDQEICQPQLIKAGGVYPGINNHLFVTGVNYSTPNPLYTQEYPFAVDSVHLFQLDLNTGVQQQHWKVATTTKGYPIYVAAQSDTIRLFVRYDTDNRRYRIINNYLTAQGSYQSNNTAPLPLSPVKNNYAQLGRKTIVSTSATSYTIFYPNSENSYSFPSSSTIPIKVVAGIMNSQDIVAGGNTTPIGWGLFRFKAGTTTKIWQNSGISGRISRIINLDNNTLYTTGFSDDQVFIKKFSALSGALVWEKAYSLYNGTTEVSDMVIDTTSNKLLLCGSILGTDNQRSAWLLQLDTSGNITAHSRRTGDSPGQNNRALCIQKLPGGQFIVGGQIQRNGLDTAAFIWGVPEQFFSVAGKVFCDLNNNGQQEGTEPNWIQTVTVQPGNYNSFPSLDGQYRVDLAAYGNYSASILLPSPHYLVAPVYFTLDATHLSYSAANIRLYPKIQTPINDAAVEVSEVTPVRYGFPTSILIDVQNLGTQSIDSLSLTLDCGNNFSLLSLTPTMFNDSLLHPISLGNGVLSATLPGSAVLQHHYLLAQGELTTFLPIGDTLVCTATIITFPGNDAVAGNNLDILKLVVLGAYDPNDITANPENGVVSTALAPDGSLDITYRIRFENTGNRTTDFLRVENEYSSLLRPSTFRIGATSAPCTVRFLENNRLEFSFPQYYLPPASADSLGAQGFVFYKMRTIPGLSVGDTIRNKAAIYFDFNPPILTNTAHTWIENAPPTATEEPTKGALSFALLPNPVKAGSVVRFSGNFPAESKWQMYSQDGRLVADGSISNGIPTLQPGIYRVICKGQTRTLVIFK